MSNEAGIWAQYAQLLRGELPHTTPPRESGPGHTPHPGELHLAQQVVDYEQRALRALLLRHDWVRDEARIVLVVTALRRLFLSILTLCIHIILHHCSSYSSPS